MKTPVLLLSLALLCCFHPAKAQYPDLKFGRPIVAYALPAKVQVALLVDNSSSMQKVQPAVSAQLWYMINQIGQHYAYAEPAREIELALFEYGNRQARSRNDFIRPVAPFTTDLDWVATEMDRFSPAGGKKFPAKTLLEATSRLRWSHRDEDIRMMIIVGNGNLKQHEDLPLSQAASEARMKGIVVHTLFAGPERKGIRLGWRDLAHETGGQYFSLHSNAGEFEYDWRMPYPQDLLSLYMELDYSYLPYTAFGYECAERRRSYYSNPDRHRLPPGAGMPVEWDLAEAVGRGIVRLNDIPKDQLPPILRDKPENERGDILVEILQKRRELQAKIREMERAEAIKTSASPGARTAGILQKMIEQDQKTQASPPAIFIPGPVRKTETPATPGSAGGATVGQQAERPERAVPPALSQPLPERSATTPKPLPSPVPPRPLTQEAVNEAPAINFEQARQEQAAREAAERSRQEQLAREAAERSWQEQLASEAAERNRQEQAARETAERSRQEQLAREAAERNRQEQVTREAAERARQEQVARETAERSRQEQLARETAERNRQEQLAREAAERSRQEQLTREAAERARQEQLAREAAERARQEQLAREAAERARQEQLAREAAERARQEQAAREAAERARQEQAAREAAERAKQEQLRLAPRPAQSDRDQ